MASFVDIHEWNSYNVYVEGEQVEDTPFAIILMLFKATAYRERYHDRNAMVRELELYAVPPLHHPKLLKDKRFKKGMRAAQGLTLHFGKWCPTPAHRNSNPRKDFPSLKAPHDFAANLVKWLAIGKDIREKLDLSFDDYIGYYPRFNVQGAYFPWLKELNLRNVTFADISQIRWIIDHSATLETLRLRNCPILIEFRTNMDVDKDMFPIPNEAAGEISTMREDMRWADVLDNFRTGLSALRDFHVSFLRPSDGMEDLDRGMTAGRYKMYAQGQILTTAYSKQVHENQLAKDTQAFISILKHIGQWKKSEGRSVAEEAEEDSSDEPGDVEQDVPKPARPVEEAKFLGCVYCEHDQ